MKALMPFTAVLAAALLGGCELVSFYRNETAGIGALELVPLYFQEKQYVTDRDLEAKVRAALAAQGLQDVEVDVYLKEVTLRGDAKALEIARSVNGVKAVHAR
jgi:osmotically-inducible protein OsmY